MISLKKNKVFLLLIALIICFISRNIYYDYKFRNIENTAISSQEEANNQSKVDLDYLNQLSKSNRKIKSIIENKNKFIIETHSDFTIKIEAKFFLIQ